MELSRADDNDNNCNETEISRAAASATHGPQRKHGKRTTIGKEGVCKGEVRTTTMSVSRHRSKSLAHLLLHSLLLSLEELAELHCCGLEDLHFST